LLETNELPDRLARVIAHAEHVWDDRAQARAWLGKPHSELQNSVPLKVARTELGACRVDELLDKLFYGLPA
jgi:putative toxin-antitoxin system antitoxin component (TIGR02293 family)